MAQDAGSACPSALRLKLPRWYVGQMFRAFLHFVVVHNGSRDNESGLRRRQTWGVAQKTLFDMYQLVPPLPQLLHQRFLGAGSSKQIKVLKRGPQNTLRRPLSPNGPFAFAGPQ